MNRHPWSTAAPPSRGDRSFDQVGADLFDASQHLRPEVLRHRGAAAALVHELLDRLLQAVLPQAGTAFVQVLPDVGAPVLVRLAVQVRIDARQDLRAGGLMRLSAAHLATSPGCADVRSLMRSPPCARNLSLGPARAPSRSLRASA